MKNIFKLLLLINLIILASCNRNTDNSDLSRYTNKITYKNSGTISSDMEITEVRRTCFYLETDEKYTTWNNFDYPFEIKNGKKYDTPSGIRSSIPLGGLGAGTVELRGDGRFMDWNIFNNSPATGNTKVQLNDALLGLWVKETRSENYVASTLRTNPPNNLPAIKEMTYQGSFPVSKITITDPQIPLQAELNAYSEFHIREAEKSATPSAIFTLNLHNPTNKDFDASFLFNLPNHIKGNFHIDNGLVLTKEGKLPDSGNMTLAATGADKVSYLTADHLPSLWNNFSSDGDLAESINKTGKYGAISAKTKIAPGQTKTITIVMAWYFPERPHTNEIIGNYYTQLYENSQDVANKTLNRLPVTWEGILQWNQLCFNNSLPSWLQDAMVNSLATMYKTSIWTKDGRFRQWESFACPDIDAVHIHFSRSLPYELFFPNLKQSIYKAYASVQEDDGYIPEMLHPILWDKNSHKYLIDDHFSGRINGDCSSIFTLGVYNNYKWNADKVFLDQMWPHVKEATQ